MFSPRSLPLGKPAHHNLTGCKTHDKTLQIRVHEVVNFCFTRSLIAAGCNPGYSKKEIGTPWYVLTDITGIKAVYLSFLFFNTAI